MALGALGIMKAGGAYVAVDPELPGERLGWMLRDSGGAGGGDAARPRPKAAGERSGVLVQGRRGSCGRRSGRGVGPTRQESGEFSSGVVAENLAYVIYTSGSTGEPKGVELTHGGLRNLVEWHCESYGLGEGDRGTQVAGLGLRRVGVGAVAVPGERRECAPGGGGGSRGPCGG